MKNRVSQYFGSEKNHDNKVRRMVSNVDWFEYILCDSEFEALGAGKQPYQAAQAQVQHPVKGRQGLQLCAGQPRPLAPDYPGQAGGGGRRPVHRPLYELLVHQADGGFRPENLQAARLQPQVPPGLGKGAPASTTISSSAAPPAGGKSPRRSTTRPSKRRWTLSRNRYTYR